MKDTIFYLGTCSTCQRIMNELPTDRFQLREIKSEGISESEIDELKAMAGSYESLFSRVAMKYKSMGLKNMDLQEKDYKNHILKEYTFLKRPVFVIDNKIFIGNSKKNIEAVREQLLD